MWPRTDALESLPATTSDSHQIVGIDTDVDAIDVVCIERKPDRTRDHTGADAQLAAVRGDEHAGQTARQVRPNVAELDMTDRLSRGNSASGVVVEGAQSGMLGAEGQHPAALERAPEICVEVLSPSNTAEEMAEKSALYFEVGAQEVWLCGLDGKIAFYTPEPCAQSAICSEFPGQI